MVQALKNTEKVAVIGGCGHVGLPLGVALALSGRQTFLVDICESAVRTVNSGHFPFLERDGDRRLQLALDKGLVATSDPSVCSDVDTFVFVTGTPVDEHLNPKLGDVLSIFRQYQEYFSENSLIVMRSTLLPGTMGHLAKRISEFPFRIKMAYCPERVAQGYALDEIYSLPQIISAFDEESFQAAYQVFAQIAPSIIRLSPLEAELTKLMTNAWRYLEFAIANQFYMIAEQNNVDFHRVYQAIRQDYPRANGYKSPGFAAGPCLFKDTMQLASYFDHQFYLGHSAMLVNEGLANFVVDKVKQKLGGTLWGRRVGILGMAFKANSDDMRESLSFRVKKALEFDGAEVFFHDPYITESTPVAEVIERSNAVIIGVPHREYRDLEIEKPMIDVWHSYRRSKIDILPGRQGGEPPPVAESGE